MDQAKGKTSSAGSCLRLQADYLGSVIAGEDDFNSQMFAMPATSNEHRKILYGLIEYSGYIIWRIGELEVAVEVCNCRKAV
jgi:hypothetical protein